MGAAIYAGVHLGGYAVHRRPNYPGIVCAALALFVAGGIWYSVFAGPWSAAVSLNGQPAAPGVMRFVVALVAAWLAAYALDNVLSFADEQTAGRGARIGFFLGVCVFGSMLVTIDFFEGRVGALIAIDAAYGVVGLTLAGAVVGAFRSRAKRAIAPDAAV